LRNLWYYWKNLLLLKVAALVHL